MGAWVTGRNSPGYLPESDTFACADWQQAADALAQEMREYADEDDESARSQLDATAVRADYPDYENTGYGDDEPSMRATVDAILKDDGPRDGRDWSALVADSDDRRIVFWLMWSPDREPDEDDEDCSLGLIGSAGVLFAKDNKHSLLLIGGQAWRWEPDGWTFEVVSLNGSPVVRLSYTRPGLVDWTYGFDRATEGRSTALVAQELYEDTKRQLLG